jgi:osmoprotectant transport system permease protein
VVAAAACVALLRTGAGARLAAGAAALAALVAAVGRAPGHLVAPGDVFGRVGPGWGWWLAALAFALLAGDALTRLRIGPGARVMALGIAGLAAAGLIAGGAIDDLSIMKEYASRPAAFWAEGRTHAALAFGAVAAALSIGVPLGLACHRWSRLATPTVAALSALQTIPSIALFALLIAPLGWIAAHVPGAAAIGVAGVGAAPAFVALTLYALLPVASSVIGGLAGAPDDTLDAARGTGMTERQILTSIKAPLAAPVFLAGLRVVTVQTIGLATVAALIGGGGFGTFVFQGVGQTAIDLVLLGAAPTVAMALAASVLLDAAAEAAGGRAR